MAFATLALEVYLIACCLFAPAGKKTFEIEVRQGKGDKGVVRYVERTDSGFSIYKDKAMKGDAISVKKDGERYVVVRESGDEKREYVIDNAKAGVHPLEKEGEYTTQIGGIKVTFELKAGTRKVTQKHSDRFFLVR
jgi:hypothetical protein